MPHDEKKYPLGPPTAESKDSGGSDQDTNKDGSAGRDHTPNGKKEEEE